MPVSECNSCDSSWATPRQYDFGCTICRFLKARENINQGSAVRAGYIFLWKQFTAAKPTKCDGGFDTVYTSRDFRYFVTPSPLHPLLPQVCTLNKDVKFVCGPLVNDACARATFISCFVYFNPLGGANMGALQTLHLTDTFVWSPKINFFSFCIF